MSGEKQVPFLFVFMQNYYKDYFVEEIKNIMQNTQHPLHEDFYNWVANKLRAEDIQQAQPGVGHAGEEGDVEQQYVGGQKPVADAASRKFVEKSSKYKCT
jgi:hypothetical protein